MADDTRIAGLWDSLVPHWMNDEEVSDTKARLQNVGPFAPSPELEKRVHEAATAWVDLRAKMDADPKTARALQPLWEHWQAWHAKWESGVKDLDGANAAIEETNVARRTVDGTNQVTDKGTIGQVKAENKSAARGVAVEIDDTASKLGVKPGGEWKIPIAIVAGAMALVGGVWLVQAETTKRLRKRTGT
jgi:hypothetical protein